MMSKRALFSVVLSCALVACRNQAGSVAKAGSLPAPAQASAAEAPLELARRMALMITRENAVVDQRIAALVALAKSRPERLETWIELGRAWVWKARDSSDPGYYLNANACVDLALDLSPGSRLALDLRALVLLNDHRFKAAAELAQSLVDADPEAPMAWGSLSDALLELGELERAERAARQMLDLKPSLPSYSRVSYFDWLHADTAAALESARLAIDAGDDPKNPEPRAWVLVQTAMMFWQQGDYAGADAGFEKALSAVAEYPPALVGRGRVALSGGDVSRAVQWFERAYRQSPLVETAWLLGAARELAGDVPGAASAFADAERDGKRGDRRTLSLMYTTRDVNAAEALRLAEQERATRADIHTEDALAWALYRNGRFSEAKAAIGRARRYGTQEARLLFHEGAILLALGARERGRRLLSEALARNPKFDLREADEAKRLLEGNQHEPRLAARTE